MGFSQQQQEFLDELRYAVLATINPDGSPQQTVMWYFRDGDKIIMNTAAGRKKDRNLRSNPLASVAFEDAYRYLAMTGTITIDTDHERGQQTGRDLIKRYSQGKEAEDAMEAVFSKQARETLIFTPSNIDAHGFE